ncbi:hypothetical protein R3X39_26285, partial [Salmonella enterica subsp. enterica serovar Agona]|nr:hypothetical protein [Salmonella enterica subsp. enterica serovar Agona]
MKNSLFGAQPVAAWAGNDLDIALAFKNLMPLQWPSSGGRIVKNSLFGAQPVAAWAGNDLDIALA